METKLQEYHRLLREAFDASEEQDAFDLDNSNVESVIKWDKLVKETRQKHVALILFVIGNPESLLGEI